jgi:outer membrane protein OmpA-like peptidoglycan-associated protein
MDNGFEGDITMTIEQGENITVGMALRQVLDQFYTDLHKVLKLKNNEVLLIGSIINAKTKTGVSAPFRFQSDSVFSTVSSPSGKFQITLPKANGKVQIIAPNFINFNEAVTFISDAERVVVKQFALQPVEKGAVVSLKNVLFYMGTANLLESSNDELDAVVAFLKSNPKVKIELNGHTDNQGDAHKDLILSQSRVDRIKDYLVSKKISAHRISGKGFGGSKPIASNATEEGRALNRRVEFVIIKH